jgi:hypothetical protein
MMRILILIFLASCLTSCASYKVVRETPEGTTQVKIFSWRKFEGLEAEYMDFKIRVDSVDATVDPLGATCILFPHLCGDQP